MTELNEEKNKGRRIIFILICGALLVVTFIILRGSSLHPWVNKDTQTDSSVFKTISMQMAHGYMPYRDTFDHKGPLLYLINFLGDMISTYRGVWVIEFAAVWVTLTFMYLIGRLYCDSVKALIVTLACGGLLMAYLSGGNLCEEYAMPFIAIGLYIFALYFKYQTINWWSLVICGACCGCVLMLRPNMIGVWAVGCIAVLIELIRNKEIKRIWNFLLFFLIGMLAVMLPILIWLGINGALIPCWEDYIAFNFSYCSGKIAGKFRAFFMFSSYPITLIAWICTILLLIQKKEENRWIAFAMLAGSLITVCTSGLYEGSESYGLVLVPVIVMPIAMIMGIFNKFGISSFRKDRNIIAYTLLIFALGLCSTGYIYWTEKTVEAYQNPDNDMKSQEVYSICKIIDECTDNDDKISVCGNNNIIYLMSNRLPATKYSYQWPIAIYKDGLMDEYYSQLKEERPKAVVVTGENQEMDAFLTDNGYNVYGTVEGDGCNVYVYSYD